MQITDKDIQRLQKYGIQIDLLNRKIVYKREVIYAMSLNNLNRVVGLILDLLDLLEGKPED
jgi:hypothetical protein